MPYDEKAQRRYMEEMVNKAHVIATSVESANLLLLSEILNELARARVKEEQRETAYATLTSVIPRSGSFSIKEHK